MKLSSVNAEIFLAIFFALLTVENTIDDAI